MQTAAERPPYKMTIAATDATRRSIQYILDAYGATWHDLVRADRSDRWRPARNALYWMLHCKGWSYSRIGRVCRRDHTSVLKALRKATQWAS